MAEASKTIPTNVTDKNTGPFKVFHDEENCEFNLLIGKEKAFLQYEIIHKETGEVDLFHTEVPPSQRGRGIAKILAKEATDYFSQQKIPMKLSCSYLQKYAKEHGLNFDK